MNDSIEEVADRLERVGDRFTNAGQAMRARDAFAAANRARRAQSVQEALQIERALMQGGAPPESFTDADYAQRQGCLAGWLGGLIGNRRTGGYGGGGYGGGFGGVYSRPSFRTIIDDDRYSDWTYYELMRHHVPAQTRDPDAWIAQHAARAGISPDTAVKDLSPDQVTNLVSAIDTSPDWSSSDAKLGSAAEAVSSSDFGSSSGESFRSGESSGSDFGSSDSGGGDRAGESSGSDFGSASDNS